MTDHDVREPTDLDARLRTGTARIDETRLRPALDELVTWARIGSTKPRITRLRLGVGIIAAVAVGSATAATAIGLNSTFPHNGRQPDAHWVYEASNGQTCDLWMRVDPDFELDPPATPADGATYLRSLVGRFDLADIDLTEALSEWLPAPNSSIGEAEGTALVMWMTHHLPDRLPDGRTPQVTIEGWVDCDAEPEE